MKTYRTLKGGTAAGRGKFIYRGQRLKFGEIVQCDIEPTDGKGNSLVDCPDSAFELVSDDAPARNITGKKWEVDFDKLAAEDTRTKPQIAADIKEKYGQAIDPRPIRKSELIAQEYRLNIMKGRDAAEFTLVGTNDKMTGLQAQEFVR